MGAPLFQSSGWCWLFGGQESRLAQEVLASPGLRIPWCGVLTCITGEVTQILALLIYDI